MNVKILKKQLDVKISEDRNVLVATRHEVHAEIDNTKK